MDDVNNNRQHEFDDGPDVDLDTEVVLLPSGERLTNAVADEIVADIYAQHGLSVPTPEEDGER